MKKIVLLLILVLSFWSCKDIVPPKGADVLFIENNSLDGIYVDGRKVLVFEEGLHQTSLSEIQFRIQTDAQDKYFNFKLIAIPTEVGKSTNATITTRGITGVSDGPYVMTLKQSDKDHLWFWNEGKKIGVVMPK